VTEPSATQTSAPVVQPRRAGNLLNILVAVAALVAIGGIAFAAGRLTAPATTAAGTGAGNGGRFLGPNASFVPGTGGRGQGLGGGFAAGANLSIRGTVTDVTSSSITLQLANGGTITLGVDGSTTYHEQESATASNVSSGQQVIVQLAGRGAGGAIPGSSAAPGSSSAPGSSQGAFSGTATDVTIAAP
jgi:hypothetical protein